MGACVMQRDQSSDVLPKIQEPSDYHAKRIKELEIEIKHFKSLSDSDLNKRLQMAYEKDIEDKKERVRKKESLLAKYVDMLSKVRAWEAPTLDHEGLKSFMISQLEESIKWDCTITVYDKPDESTKLTVDKYRKEKLAELLKELDRNTEEHKKELERTEARNKWIRDLYQNLEKYKNA